LQKLVWRLRVALREGVRGRLMLNAEVKRGMR
jgi:hypothetical protein